MPYSIKKQIIISNIHLNIYLHRNIYRFQAGSVPCRKCKNQILKSHFFLYFLFEFLLLWLEHFIGGLLSRLLLTRWISQSQLRMSPKLVTYIWQIRLDLQKWLIISKLMTNWRINGNRVIRWLKYITFEIN